MAETAEAGLGVDEGDGAATAAARWGSEVAVGERMGDEADGDDAASGVVERGVQGEAAETGEASELRTLLPLRARPNAPVIDAMSMSPVDPLPPLLLLLLLLPLNFRSRASGGVAVAALLAAAAVPLWLLLCACLSLLFVCRFACGCSGGPTKFIIHTETSAN